MQSFQSPFQKLIFSIAIAMFLLAIAPAVPAQTPGPSGYHVIKSVPLSGDGGWDYVSVDSDARRIYISHSTRVLVLDADSYEQAGEIADTQGVHGIALAPELGRGFTSNGRSSNVTIFDLKTLKPLGSAATGKNPDAIVYEPVTKRVFTFNGGSKDSTAINAADGTVAGTVALGGRPEFAVVDGKGKVFANIENTSEIVALDAATLKVLSRWPLKPCEGPSGLAIDAKNRRLFSGCDNKLMAIVDADTGKILATPKIGDGVDATAYDPSTGLAFSSNGEGTLTVIKQNSQNAYSVLDNVPTKKSARTMGLDLKTHTIVLPSADLIPPKQGERWPSVKPGTLALLIVGK